MASKSLTFDIFGRDRSASRTMNSIGSRAAAVGKKVALAAAAIGAAVAVAAAKFAGDSVQAAIAAEAQQVKLTAAWAKFPKTADLAIEALREYNSVLATKTKYDDDNIATGQAVLAQFKLTGAQIQKLTPLLLDYASTTGKDLPTAAEDLGKALLGQGRSLKEIGVQFKDTGSLAGNFDLLVQSLSGSVGGFAEKEGSTAAGKLEILKNRFGEVQEAIGYALMPALEDLLGFINTTVLPGLEDFSVWFKDEGLPAVRDFIGWIDEYKGVLGPAAVAVGGLTVAQLALNAAMLANPVGLVVLAIAGMIAQMTILVTNVGGIRTTLTGFASGLLNFFTSVAVGISTVAEGAINVLIGGLQTMLTPLNAILRALGQAEIKIPKATFAAQTRKGAAFVSVFGAATVAGSYNKSGSQKFGRYGGAAAEGGIIPARPGGWMINAGEGGESEVIIPLSRLGGMGGGLNLTVQLSGVYAGTKSDLARTIRQTIVDARKTGAIPAGAF